MKRNKWSKEICEDLHHKQGLSLEEIAEKRGVKVKSVRGMMFYYKVPIRHQKNQWSRELLYDLYHNQNLSTGEIAHQYNCSYITIGSQLVYYGIPLRSITEAAQLRSGADNYNVSFFENWSPEFAWYLGWMFTDGSITRDLREANLTLKDKSVCDKIAVLLGDGVTVRPIKNLWRVGVYRKDLVAKLVDYGLAPNKTKTLTFPYIPKEYLSHFVRGVWDGDGSFTIRRGRTRLTALFGCASLSFTESLVNVLNQEVGIRIPKLFEEKAYTFWRLAYHGDNALALADWVYQDSADHNRLARKYEVYLRAERY